MLTSLYHGMMMNKVINQDCLEYMATLDDGSVDCIISSPPYNIGRTYRSYGDNKENYIEWMNRVWREACRILKPEGHLFLNIQPSRKDPLLPYRIADNIPWQVQNTFIWNKCIEIDGYVRGHGTVADSKRYQPNGWEYVFHFTHKGDTDIDRLMVPYQPKWQEANTRKSGRTHRPSVNSWFIPYETNGILSNKKTEHGDKHPAVFPTELAVRCLKLSQAQNVYDPFGGTGTVLVAAKQLNIPATMTEIDPDYCRLAENR